MQKGRQTAHVAMPYWMRDTYNGLTPPPNLEAEILDKFCLQEARQTGYTQCDGWRRVRASGLARGRSPAAD